MNQCFAAFGVLFGFAASGAIAAAEECPFPVVMQGITGLNEDMDREAAASRGHSDHITSFESHLTSKTNEAVTCEGDMVLSTGEKVHGSLTLKWRPSGRLEIDWNPTPEEGI